MQPALETAMDGDAMTLKTYQAKSMAQALSAVKRDLGKDAVILHTRTFKRGGFFGYGAKLIVEVTAGTGGALGKRRRRETKTESLDLRQQAQRHVLDRTYKATAPREEKAPLAAAVAIAAQAGSDQYLASAGQAVGAATLAAPPTRQPSASAVEPLEEPPLVTASPPPAEAPVYRTARRLVTQETQAAAPAAAEINEALNTQISDLRAMVAQVVQQTHRPAQRADMSEALFDRYLSLLQSEVSADIANTVVERVGRELTSEELEDAGIVRATVLRELAAYIPVAEVSLDKEKPRDGRPLTIALVGPTGVGKTTTTAKLAAAYKLRHNRKVGLVTADTYRIAAVDQLRTYANIIGLPLRVALTPNEMASAVQSLRDCDVVLIDTAGRSQHDGEKIEDLRKFVFAAEPHEVHLVLSSTSSEKLMLRAAERFAPVEPTSLIFTKLDEAVSFGVLVNVIQTVKKRISFVTTGQEVPDHIEIGRADRLARIVVSGEVS